MKGKRSLKIKNAREIHSWRVAWKNDYVNPAVIDNAVNYGKICSRSQRARLLL